MRPTVGIICEYDPFHRGHARQFSLVREQLPDARILCVMSGCFTQRGMPALFSPAFRAQAALRAGADTVLELPCAFAVRDAENFALGGVSLLHRLGTVTHLSFGAETDDLARLHSIAALLENPDDVFRQTLRSALGEGRPFVAAQARAAAASLTARDGGGPAATETLAALLTRPNNILGICYLRALLRLGSPIQPLPVKREGDYHAADLSAAAYPSASAVRKAFLAGDAAAA
ncbi:MAG: nucleotidyltransferase family protein, partial [Eubacteriales bacterium]|nr:nucleotidyltransferase family protein [Eubacteriales bacterium]